MKLKSKISEINLQPKDIVLQKRTKWALTTETYLKIPEQPKNTCPLIDKTIEQLDKSFFENRFSSINEIIHELSGLLKSNKPKEDETATCNCYEEYKDNYREFEHFLYTLKDVSENKIKVFKRDFESFRTSCELIRAYGDELKTLLWENFKSNEELVEAYNKHLLTKPELSMTFEKIDKNFEELSKQISLPNYSNIQCKEYCDNCTKDGDLVTFYLTECRKINPELSGDLEEAYRNYKSLVEWVTELDTLIQKKINNELKDMLSFTDDELQAYVQLFNDHYKFSNVEYYFIRDLKNIEKISMEKELEEFHTMNESLIIKKKIQELEVTTNQLIEEYLNFNIHQDYESLCDKYANIYNRAKDLNESIIDYFNLTEIENVKYYVKVLTKIRTALSNMASNISNSGPQIFELKLH